MSRLHYQAFKLAVRSGLVSASPERLETSSVPLVRLQLLAPTHPLRRRICPFDPNEIYQTLYRRPQTNCDWTRERPNFRKMEVHKVMIHARVSEFNGPWLLKLDV